MRHDPVKKCTTIKLHDAHDLPRWEHWLELDALPIALESWPVSNYRPRTEVRLMVHDETLYIRLASFEPDPEQRHSKCRETGGAVHLDSCLEAFIAFSDEEDEPYFNFEFNSLGTPHIAVGTGRENRRVLPPAELAALRINCLIDVNPEGEYEEGWWQIHYQVPASWLHARLGREVSLGEGQIIRANFYKCGDETPIPHYLSWAEIKTVQPDFHQPKYFKRLKIAR